MGPHVQLQAPLQQTATGRPGPGHQQQTAWQHQSRTACVARAQGTSAGARMAGRHGPESVCPALSKPLPRRLISSSHTMTCTDEAAATEVTPMGDTQEGRVRTRHRGVGGAAGRLLPGLRQRAGSARRSPGTKVLGPGWQLFRPLPLRPAGTPGSVHDACWGQGDLGAPQVILASRRRVQDALGPAGPRAGGWAPGSECRTASLLTQRSGHGLGADGVSRAPQVPTMALGRMVLSRWRARDAALPPGARV